MVKTPLAEIRDQSLHFSYCFALALAGMIGRPYLWAVPIAFITVYGIAMLREWYQHGRLIWFNRDLGFSGLGAVAGSSVLFFV